MKRTFLLLLLMVVFSAAIFAQRPSDSIVRNAADIISNDIVERTNGFIEAAEQLPGEGNYSYIVVIELPSYYDFELIRSMTNNVRRYYNNITLGHHWFYDEEIDAKYTHWIIDENDRSKQIDILVYFVSETKIAVVSTTTED